MKTNRNVHSRGLLAFALLVCGFASGAETITASSSNSELTFNGEHAGMPFSGTFEQWQSTLILPPAESPTITATFELSSAKTGDWTYDSTLPEADWFNTEVHPKGAFTSLHIAPSPKGVDVSGELTLRGITKPIEFSLEGSRKMGYTATITIDRLAFDIGKESDPDAEWVSRDIVLRLTINR